MGERRLGQVPVQESWDIAIGRNQTPLIQLGYEGVTIEHVLEKRLKAQTFAEHGDGGERSVSGRGLRSVSEKSPD